MMELLRTIDRQLLVEVYTVAFGFLAFALPTAVRFAESPWALAYILVAGWLGSVSAEKALELSGWSNR